MKALWLVSFRPIGKSKDNDKYQNSFVDSVKKLNFDITFSITQFDEQNVEQFVQKKEIKNFYKNISKKDVLTIAKMVFNTNTLYISYSNTKNINKHIDKIITNLDI